MSRGLPFLTLLALAGCSNLLGLKPPHEAPGGDAQGDDDAPPAGNPSDFTVQLAHPGARVPAGGFDFIEVTVNRKAGDAVAITVDIPQPPPGITTVAGTIGPNETKAFVRVNGDNGLTIGDTLDLDVVATDDKFTHDVHVDTAVTGIPGSLDKTFGGTNTGFIDIPLGSLAGSFTGIQVASDDSVVAAGTVSNSIASTAQISVLHPDGTLLASQTTNPCGCSGGGSFNSLVIESSGRIVAFGTTVDKAFSPSRIEPFSTGFTSAGPVDTTYGSMGTNFVATGDGEDWRSLALDATNLIGVSNTGNLFRITQNGSGIDLNWNSGEALPLAPLALGGFQAVAVDPTQHIYVAGQLNGNAVIERITENAVVDAAFATAGVADSGVAGIAKAAIVQKDHGVIVAGEIGDGSGIVLFRVKEDGTFDTAFGTAGIAKPPGTAGLGVTAMTIQADGKIIVAGNMGGAVLVRLLPNGQPDITFGNNGVVSVAAGLTPIMGGVAVQSNGMIVISGGNADQPHSNGVDGNGMIARVQF